MKHSMNKKIIAVLFIVMAISAMIGLAFQKISAVEFWLTIAFCAAFAWIVLPRMR